MIMTHLPDYTMAAIIAAKNPDTPWGVRQRIDLMDRAMGKVKERTENLNVNVSFVDWVKQQDEKLKQTHDGQRDEEVNTIPGESG